jgi:hypothetical protein
MSFIKKFIFIIVLLVPGLAFGATETFYCTANGDASAPETLGGAFDMSDVNNVANWDTDDEDDGKIGYNDEVLFYDDDGNFTTALVIPSSGGDTDNKVTLKAGTGENPVIFPATELTKGSWGEPDADGIAEYSFATFDVYLTIINDGGTLRRLFHIHPDIADATRLDYLNNASDATISAYGENNYASTIDFWDMLETMTGYDGDTNTLYYSERNGDDPDDNDIYVAGLTTKGIDFNGQSWVVVDGFTVLGAYDSIDFDDGATNNEVKNCTLYHGVHAVTFSAATASNNSVHDCETDMIYYGAQETGTDLGAGTAGNNTEISRRQHMYYFGKFAMGNGASYNKQIYSVTANDGNQIYNNEIKQGLVGISMESSTNVDIYGNDIHNFVSVGLVVRKNLTGDIYKNTIYDCYNCVRFHELDASGDTREINFYLNRVWNEGAVGRLIYGNWATAAAPVGNVRIYHNSLGYGYTAFKFDTEVDTYGVPYWWVYSNVLSAQDAWDNDTTWIAMAQGVAWTFKNNWVGGTYVHQATSTWMDGSFGNVDAEGTDQYGTGAPLHDHALVSSSTAVDAGFDWSAVTTAWYDDANCMGYWAMSAASGNETDLSGEGGTLSESSSPNSIPSSMDVPAFHSGTSRDFDVADTEYLGLADNDGNGPDIYGEDALLTLCGWVKIDSDQSADQRIATKATQYYLEWDHSNNKWRFYIYDFGAATTAVYGDTTGITTGKWMHFCGVYNDVDLRIYRNGVLDATPVAETDGIQNTANSFRVGSALDGKVKNVCIFNRALSADEIKEMYDFDSRTITHTADINSDTVPFDGTADNPGGTDTEDIGALEYSHKNLIADGSDGGTVEITSAIDGDGNSSIYTVVGDNNIIYVWPSAAGDLTNYDIGLMVDDSADSTHIYYYPGAMPYSDIADEGTNTKISRLGGHRGW